MRATLVAILLAGLALPASIDAKPKSTKPQVAPDLTGLPVEQLIARFQDEPATSIAADASARAETFVAVPPPNGFRVDQRGTPFPRVSPTMRELVRRGAAVVPVLLDHLSDTLPTKLILNSKSFTPPAMAQYFGNEYDPRQRDADGPPPGLYPVGQSGYALFDRSGQKQAVQRFESYPLKVGDVCFAALGQIVNRRLVACRGLSGFAIEVNSPVQSPTLAAAARADWNGLTVDGFRDFLKRDVEWTDKPSEDVQPALNLYALQRLLFYYPADGVALAVRLLDRPLVHSSEFGAFCQRLLDTDDPAVQDQLLENFRAQRGQDDYQCALQMVAHIAARPLATIIFPAWRSQWTHPHENAVKLVERRFTEAEKHPTFVKSEFDLSGRRQAVVAVTLYPSAEIDAAVRQTMARACALQIKDLSEKFEQCELVATCAERIFPPAYREGVAHDIRRLRHLEGTALEHEERIPAYLHACDEFLWKIAADPALQVPPDQR